MTTNSKPLQVGRRRIAQLRHLCRALCLRPNMQHAACNMQQTTDKMEQPTRWACPAPPSGYDAARRHKSAAC